MKLLDRLRKAKTPKEEVKEEVEQEEGISEAELTETLKSFLYSDDLVSEYAHIFRKLYEYEEFPKVMELIQAKETELNSINENKESFEQVSEVEVKKTSESETEDKDGEDYLMSILNDRYGE